MMYIKFSSKAYPSAPRHVSSAMLLYLNYPIYFTALRTLLKERPQIFSEFFIFCFLCIRRFRFAASYPAYPKGFPYAPQPKHTSHLHQAPWGGSPAHPPW